jgi:hypothetical protein
MSDSLEKLGLFYLGRRVDPDTRKVTDAPVLYESKDLVTHAAIIGMTGSGKTGLGIGIIEEAAIDGIPVLAIDPKGDLGNLLLTFPDLSEDAFAPWVNPDDARAQGLAAIELAAKEALRWQDGLAGSGQSGDRIARLRAAADFAIYTPGSKAGTGLSIMKSFAPPTDAVLEDDELVGERVSTAATTLLTLAGIEADPLRSREHVLIATLLGDAWRNRRTLDLPALVAAIQSPPFSKVGVLDLESFYPAAGRFELAMRLNHLLASPDFAAWLEGEPLDVGALLHSPQGKPRVSIVSIAHLDDRERTFFVSLLLNELVGWVRSQRGTSSLRALIYFDEVVGFLPPIANPPSKPPLLALLKQARAFGVGLVLATQNPVDLDYKALSNAGTWFLGRLQTQRDKDRLLDGLEGVSAGALDRAQADAMLSSLAKRVFLLHNVHDGEPVLFQTRWTMSYLRGPLTRQELSRLSPRAARRASAPRVALASPKPPESERGEGGPAASASARGEVRASYGGTSPGHRPVLDPAIPQYYAPGTGTSYVPALLGAVRVAYSDTKLGVDAVRDVVVTTPLREGVVTVDWELAEPASFTLHDLSEQPREQLPYAALPSAATDRKKVALWTRELARWAARSQSVDLLRSARAKLTSRPDESEREFRIRVQESAREARDAAIEKTRQKYASRLATAEDRIRRAETAVQREQEQAAESKMQTGVSIAATIAGALLGRRAVSASTLGRATTAARGMGRVGREAQDVARAEANVAALRTARDTLAADLQRELQQVAARFDASGETFERVLLKPKRGAVSVQTAGIVWIPA